MRYINNTRTSKYLASVNNTLNPGSSSVELDTITDFVSSIRRESCGCQIQLSARDRDCLLSLLADDAAARASSPPRRRDPVNDANLTAVADAAAIAKQEAIDAAVERDKALQARINSESVYFGPDGRPVEKTDADQVAGKVKAGDIQPRIVQDPMSALDILSHNAAVTQIRAESPLAGKEAVAARAVPGMPTLPGYQRHMQNLRMEDEIAEAHKNGSLNTKYMAMADDLIRSAEANNYGRKP